MDTNPFIPGQSPIDVASPGGMIVREMEPLNLEMPFGSVRDFLTPVDHFFIRSHFPMPSLDLESWRLKVEGEVTTSLELTLEELKKLPWHTFPATLECAGNGRAFLSPQTKGAQWERGAVSNAEWTGVFLADVLRRAGIKDSAREVILEGADSGEIKEPPGPSGKIHYSRSLPLQKAMEDVLLAFKMNGRELTRSHGFPLRAVVPGWYGMASVKWLNRLYASPTPFHGYYQTVDYSTWEVNQQGRFLVPIRELQVKAQMARPGIGDIIPAGTVFRVFGAAWTGGADIVQVDFSADNGRTWQKATLLGNPVRHAWRLWEFLWQVPSKAGSATLLARAVDSEGRTQPEKRDDNRGGYVVNHLLPIEVHISSGVERL